MIATLESVHGRALRSARSPLDFVAKRLWQSTTLPPFKAIAEGSTFGAVAVQVNHGRWLVECPTENCSGACLASESDHRFVCAYCGAGPFEVVWPQDREAIEGALSVRPPMAQNWHPGETVEELLDENAARGVG